MPSPPTKKCKMTSSVYVKATLSTNTSELLLTSSSIDNKYTSITVNVALMAKIKILESENVALQQKYTQ